MLGCNERDRDGDEVNWDQLGDLEMGLQTRIWGRGRVWGAGKGFRRAEMTHQMAGEKDQDA